MSTAPKNARRTRPDIEKSYGIPEDEAGMLSWDAVEARLSDINTKNYWVCTVTPEQRPHSVPVWGVWVEGTLYHGGGTQTRRHKNLVNNPLVSVHLENGTEAVILEGAMQQYTEADLGPELAEKIESAYEAKYGMRHGFPTWGLSINRAFAWTVYPTTVTRWVFDAEA